MSAKDKHTQWQVQAGHPLKGTASVPGDKSLSHRAVLFSALAEGESRVRGWLPAGDTLATLQAVQALGIAIDRQGNDLTIQGGHLTAPTAPLNFVNAGTGIRLAAGIMVGQPFSSVLDGSGQLRRRPMRRIIDPLRAMGAQIRGENDRAPLIIEPVQLRAARHELKVASAQVKSAILLAGLFAEGETVVLEPGPARDHTERMLQAMGADLKVEGYQVSITSRGRLQPIDITVPGDFSSAAFLMVAAAIVPGSELIITGVNLNTTRTGLLDVLLAMGADIDMVETGIEAGEPVGTITVRHGSLRGIEIGGDLVVRMIDEFPVFMVAALQAEGRTHVREAHELRVKETDRIAVMSAELRRMGAIIEEHDDGFNIIGPQSLNGALVDGHDDHRVAMSLAVAGLVAQGTTTISDADCAADSFPGFAEVMSRQGASIRTLAAADSLQ